MSEFPDVMPNPRGWDWGPPKSENEGWIFDRRSTVLSIATNILTVRTRDPEAWNQSDKRETISDAVDTAMMLVEELDKRFPRPKS